MTTTLSQLVDTVVALMGRPGQESAAASWLNSTIRELHATKEGLPVIYQKNMFDLVLTADVEDGFVWIPPDGMQVLRTVKYITVVDKEGEPIYPKGLNPGRAQRGQTEFYYRNADNVAFTGYGGVGAMIALAHYQYLVGLDYFAVGLRPTEFLNGAFVYYDLTSSGGIDYDTDDATRLLARQLTTNWMLNDWEDTLSTGARQKGYADSGDADRSRSLFARYSNQRTQLAVGEGSSTLHV